jgi:two-component system sensor histidine kinase GlrK
LVKQVLEAQQLTVVSQRVRLEVKVDDLTLKADRGKMRLIIENLLSNAIKYSPKGGTVYLHAAKQDTQLMIDVADAGSGIPRMSAPRVRSLLYRPPPAGVQVKGTGIGLSVVLEFVNAHGGTIEIVDGEYPGAHFRIRMPVCRSPTRPDAGACGISSPSPALALVAAARRLRRQPAV